jgi:hypothetical protein
MVLERGQPHVQQQATPLPPHPPSISGLTSYAGSMNSSDHQRRERHGNFHDEEPEARRPRVEIKSQIAEGIVDAVFAGRRIDEIEEISGGATIRETFYQI